jgi:adenylyltransferase/sulfurtransferase
VLGAAVAIVAAAQVSDAIKLLVGERSLVARTLTEFDLWSNTRRTIDLSSANSPACPCCARRDFEFLSAARGVRSVWMCGQNAVQVFPDRSSIPDADADDAPSIVHLAHLADRLRPHGDVTLTRFMARVALAREPADDGGPVHLSVFPDGRAIIKGIRDPQGARAIYDRYVGT